MKYENAADILPQELLEEIRRYFPDGLLWIPKTNDSRPVRDELIIKLIEKKLPVKEVAKIAKMTPRQVYRIIKKHRSEEA
ncbi:MAG: helix-turn-helix domain-containing protein [bacterium]